MNSVVLSVVQTAICAVILVSVIILLIRTGRKTEAKNKGRFNVLVLLSLIHLNKGLSGSLSRIKPCNLTVKRDSFFHLGYHRILQPLRLKYLDVRGALEDVSLDIE